jgi:hypothetical protein
MKIIPKGWHIAINQFTSISIGTYHGGIGAIVKFTDSCRYVTKDPQNQADWNKLFGQSWGFFPLIKQYQMHYNSSRFAWRYNIENDCIEVAAYYYVNGQRFYETNSDNILSIPADPKGGFKEVYLGIVPLKMNNSVMYTYAFNFEMGSFGIEFTKSGIQKLAEYRQELPRLSGFFAPIYFGGDETAPHTIKIGIRNV